MPRSFDTATLTLSPNNNGGPRHLSRISAGIIALITVVFTFIYSCAIYLSHRHAQRHPRTIDKKSGVRLQRYGPGAQYIPKILLRSTPLKDRDAVVYACTVYSSLVEIAVASWLLLQFHFNNNEPNALVRVGVRLILFSAIWTTSTGAAFTLLILHPLYSTHPIASIGAQASWVLLTWIFWVVGAAVVNAALPVLLTGGSCFGLIYCEQMQALFAIAVIEIMTLTLGMLIVTWLVWKSARSIW